ncbi:unnamed protein product [Strongylus vulgaris]|uniref:PDZ domain-containing protein n=1 Tax=Strongylus vulgaris TaxID=40348 RepID=A0A3P7JIH3_STRVU|nr:unnamed protein product [Strongylus vulgaris]
MEKSLQKRKRAHHRHHVVRQFLESVDVVIPTSEIKSNYPNIIDLLVTMIDSFKLPRKLLDTGTQKSFSVENVNEASGKVGVLLKSENAAGFGMMIQGNMNEGIFVKEIVPMGAAYQTGNILPGDRIKTLTICFDNMVYEDALTLLSYASPYKVKFELERKIETPPPMDGDMTNARLHPLFRSNTLTHIQFNPISSPSPRPSSDEETEKIETPPPVEKEPETETVECKSPKCGDIEMVEQKAPETIASPEPLTTKVISEVADSTTIGGYCNCTVHYQ